MAFLWTTDANGQWLASPLDGNRCRLSAQGIREGEQPGCQPPEGLLLLSESDAGQPRWVLLTQGGQLQHNGLPLLLGVTVLADRDEIVIPAAEPDAARRFFFSSERLAAVEPFPLETPATCPRCRQSLNPGQPAVRCPACGVWHHQLTERPCWSYAELCAACQAQTTALGGRFRWTPEDL
jgi:hypothetical protein